MSDQTQGGDAAAKAPKARGVMVKNPLTGKEQPRNEVFQELFGTDTKENVKFYGNRAAIRDHFGVTHQTVYAGTAHTAEFNGKTNGEHAKIAKARAQEAKAAAKAPKEGAPAKA